MGFNEYKGHSLIKFDSVKDVSSMFKGCSETEELDLSFFPFLVNIENMKNLFCGCKELKKIENLDNWKTSRVTNMEGILMDAKN